MTAPAELGPFTLLAPLGRGAMGAVWRARDRRTGQEVALKRPHVRLDAARRERFLREGRVAAGLSHPGLVAVRDAGEVAGEPYLAYELVEGARTLDEVLAGAPLRRKVELVRDAARALGAAHARGVVHRDVKPQNILVDGEGRVRVADFGLALAADLERLTHTGALLGTPAYMAPEQVRTDREAVGPATDVWALGVVLYQALTGQLPFDAGSLPELVGQLLDPSPAPPRELAPEVPPELEAVVGAALAASVAARPRSGEALAQLLDGWLASPGAAGGGRRRPGRRPRRRPLVAGGLAALALALAGLAAVALGVRPAPDGAPVAAIATATPAQVASEGASWPERDALIARGRAALKAGRWDEAIEPLEQARALRETPRLLVGLAQAYLGRGDAAKGDLEVARRCADRALELEVEPRDDLQAHLERATAWTRLGDAAAALVDLEAALGLDPRSTRAHQARLALLVGPPGDIALRGTVQEVFDAADAWLAVAPRAVEPRHARVKAFVSLGDLRRAEEEMSRAIEEQGATAGYLSARAGVRAKLGELEGAVADCTAALALAPEHVASLMNRAACRVQLGQPEEALVDADAAVRLVPGDAVVRSNRSRMRTLAGDPAGGLTDADEALALAPDDPNARYNRAVALSALGRTGEAGTELQRLTRSARPDVAAEALVDLGYFELSRGAKESALELAGRALERAPRHARAFGLRGAVRSALGRPREALDDLDKAIALAPNVPDFYGGRAVTHEAIGDREAARADFEAMLRLLPPSSPVRAEVEARLGKLR